MAVNENEFFRQATLRICRHLDIEKGLSACLRYLSTIMPADMICLEIYEPDIRALRIIAKASLAEYGKTDLLIPLDQKARGMMEKIYRRFKKSVWLDAVAINDPNTDPVAPLVLEMLQAPGSALMHMVLETEGRPLCSLMIVAQDKRRFTDEDARLLSLLKEPFSVAMANALKHREVLHFRELLADDNRFLQRQLLSLSGDQIIGADFGLKSVMEKVRQVAAHDSPVLLLGETGTGKDVLANAIHYSSARREAAFIAVNCGAIPENLMDSELFGHEKGAFTHAASRRRGFLEIVSGGTLFFDEVGEVSKKMQMDLLRTLEEKMIYRVGSRTAVPVDFRLVSATSQALDEKRSDGSLREDFFYRIGVIEIKIPPLRDRREDVPLLVEHFLRKYGQETTKQVEQVTPAAIERLMQYDWPGNVRELQNAIERAVVLSRGATLHQADFAFLTPPAVSLPQQTGTLRQREKRYVYEVLCDNAWNITRSAAVLGINRVTLHKKIKRYGFERKLG